MTISSSMDLSRRFPIYRALQDSVASVLSLCFFLFWGYKRSEIGDGAWLSGVRSGCLTWGRGSQFVRGTSIGVTVRRVVNILSFHKRCGSDNAPRAPLAGLGALRFVIVFGCFLILDASVTRRVPTRQWYDGAGAMHTTPRVERLSASWANTRVNSESPRDQSASLIRN
jgi:hypothetical protein